VTNSWFLNNVYSLYNPSSGSGVQMALAGAGVAVLFSSGLGQQYNYVVISSSVFQGNQHSVVTSQSPNQNADSVASTAAGLSVILTLSAAMIPQTIGNYLTVTSSTFTNNQNQYQTNYGQNFGHLSVICSGLSALVTSVSLPGLSSGPNNTIALSSNIFSSNFNQMMCSFQFQIFLSSASAGLSLLYAMPYLAAGDFVSVSNCQFWSNSATFTLNANNYPPNANGPQGALLSAGLALFSIDSFVNSVSGTVSSSSFSFNSVMFSRELPLPSVFTIASAGMVVGCSFTPFFSPTTPPQLCWLNTFSVIASSFLSNTAYSALALYDSTSYGLVTLSAGLGASFATPSESNTLLISQCNFRNNSLLSSFSSIFDDGTIFQATLCSAGLAAYQGPSHPFNSLQISSSLFDSNQLWMNPRQVQLTGAISVAGISTYFDTLISGVYFSFNSSVSLSDSVFLNNNSTMNCLEGTARYSSVSAGLSLYSAANVARTAPYAVMPTYHWLTISGSNFSSNINLNNLDFDYYVALAGAGLSLYSDIGYAQNIAEIFNSIFDHNTNIAYPPFGTELSSAGGGASLFLYSSASGNQFSIINSTLSRNRNIGSSAGSGAIHHLYVGVGPFLGNSLNLLSSVFADNESPNGAALTFFGSGAILKVDSSLFLRNRAFCQSSCCCSGGAFSLTDVVLSFTNSQWIGNEASYSAGALLLEGLTQGQLSNCSFSDNYAVSFGSDITAESTGVLRLVDTTVVMYRPPASVYQTVSISCNPALIDSSSNSVFSCPVGNVVYNSSLFIGCQVCNPGSYLLTNGTSFNFPYGASSQCNLCPDLAGDCSLGGSLINVTQGYFAVRSADSTLEISACPADYCCKEATCFWNNTCRFVVFVYIRFFSVFFQAAFFLPHLFDSIFLVVLAHHVCVGDVCMVTAPASVRPTV
jgi:hypothetical protein